ncbi:hypothetical protein MS_053 [Vibrio phage VPMS1]|uniref:hypothetical protein n=1 Tax=Vibrio phage VPMS1 TaxID=1233488 RepID=UPI0003585393|nr:hypothetical protein MS_053 [Vibrio phage VPMS1]AFV51132.1 hypothetical protein MS_053 [Vibrio phage VPMS1]
MAILTSKSQVTQGELLALQSLTKVDILVLSRAKRIYVTVRVSNHQAMALVVAQHQQSYPNSPLTEAMSLCVDDQHPYILIM